MPTVRLMFALSAVLLPSAALAQHEAHQAAPGSGADMAACSQAQPSIQNIIVAATARLESARQSNSPAEMRAAIDSLDAALRDIRTQLAPCATLADPDAGRKMPNMQATPAAAASPATPKAASTPVDPHAGHQMPPKPAAAARP